MSEIIKIYENLSKKEFLALEQTKNGAKIKTACGIEEEIDIKEQFNDFTAIDFYYEGMKMLREKSGEVIRRVVLTKKLFSIGFENGTALTWRIKGIKEVDSIHLLNRGREAVVKVVGYERNQACDLVYFKTEKGWELSEAVANMGHVNKEIYELADKYDVIHHPSVRLLLIT